MSFPNEHGNVVDLLAAVRGFCQAQSRIAQANTGEAMGAAVLESHAYRHDMALMVGEPCGCSPEETCPGPLT
jgi:hypothetical protein